MAVTDVSRIDELRRIDPFYRLFQPVLSLLARINRVIFRDRLPEVYRQIRTAGLPRFWLPEEYLARMEVVALCTAPLWIYLLFAIFGADGMLLAPLAIIGTGVFLRYRLAVRAAAPIAVDQAPHAVPVGPADAVDGGRGHLPQRPEPGRR